MRLPDQEVQKEDPGCVENPTTSNEPLLRKTFWVIVALSKDITTGMLFAEPTVAPISAAGRASSKRDTNELTLALLSLEEFIRIFLAAVKPRMRMHRGQNLQTSR